MTPIKDNHPRIVRLTLYACAAAAGIYVALLYIFGRSVSGLELGLALFLFAFSAWGQLEHWLCSDLRAMEWQGEKEHLERRVDPWNMQATLMLASDQRIPREPRLHNGVLLYAALQAEELGEEYGHLAQMLFARLPASDPTWTAAHEELFQLFRDFRSMSEDLRDTSLAIREKLRDGLSVDSLMTAAEAVALCDDVTDGAVVNAGFALSCGFDGGAAYREVAGSNLSKRNPDTGRIDKTPDGKWIKGRDYREPNLARIIASTRAASPE